MIIRALILCFAFGTSAFAQGFAGLGSDAEGFSVPMPDPEFIFPQDHGPHPDFRIEWWYLTANLMGPDGTKYGVQWTLFRSALAPETQPGWQDPQVWFAHAAVTTPTQHFSAERVARGGIGQAGVTTEPFEAWIDDWRMVGSNFDQLTLSASDAKFRYDLELAAKGPLVFHGDAGYSVKSEEGQASYYYSQPFFEVRGVLKLPERSVPVTGNAWLDREWSSQPLADTQTGWDWFSLSFESGEKLMGFQLRQTDGNNFTSGTWISPEGETTALANGEFVAEPIEDTEVAGRVIPTRWRVLLAEREIDVEVQAINSESWMDVSLPYWEGPVQFNGSHKGRGYLEMTGYE